MILWEAESDEPIFLRRGEFARNAELESGNAFNDGDYEPSDITRDEARSLAAALLAYADTVDPGPGAPFPWKSLFLAHQRIEQRQRDMEEDGRGGWRPIPTDVG